MTYTAIRKDKCILYSHRTYNYLGSMISNDARRTREIKSRVAMANAAFGKKKILFNSKLEEIRKVLQLEHSYIW